MDAAIGGTTTNGKLGSQSGRALAGEWRRNPLVRTVLSSLFMLLMLAAAHLLMVVVNYAEHRIAHPTPAAGSPARMFTDVTLPEEIAAALKKSANPEEQRVLTAALAEVRAGKDIALRTLPVTPFLAQATMVLVALGSLLMWATSRLKSDAAQSIVGVFAGNLLWTGGIEYGLTMAARTLGVAKSVAVVDGQVVAIYGEYVLLKYTWGALVMVMAYLMFLEASRCPLALWWRRHVPTMRGAIATGKIDNYGPRSAFQYATTVWGFYLILLWAYDEDVFGVHSIFTNALLFASLAGSLYCVWRLYQFKGWGPSIRFAVGAMIVVWTPIEILGKWGVFRAPWILLQSSSFLLFFGGLALGTWWLWRAQRRKSVLADIDGPPPVIAVEPAPIRSGRTRAASRTRPSPGSPAPIHAKVYAAGPRDSQG